MENNDLDKFIKGKLENQEFEYNPHDWQNALKLIEKKEEKRRPLWIWWAAAGLVLMLSAGLYFNSPNSVAGSTIANADSSEKEVQKEHNSQTNNESATINQEEVQIEEALVSQVELKSSTTNGSNTTTVQKEVIPKITSQETGYYNLPDPISGNNPNVQPISSPVSESVADARAGEDFSSSTSEEKSVAKPPIEGAVTKPMALDKFYDSQSIILLAPLDRIGKNHYEPTTFAWETPKLPSRIEPFEEMEVKLGFGWGASAYVNPYIGNLDGEKRQITGFSGGLSTMYRLDKTISLNADLLYTYRTGTFDKSNISETKRYSFEALDGISTLNPKALHYVSLPVYAGLHFGRHKVSLGGSLNYLGAVRGDVVDQTVDSQGTIVKETITPGWIQKDGFTSFNIGGMIGYDYAITNRWNISFRSNYLFNPIIDQSLSEKINSFIVKENSQVNLQIGSTYYFR